MAPEVSKALCLIPPCENDEIVPYNQRLEPDIQIFKLTTRYQRRETNICFSINDPAQMFLCLFPDLELFNTNGRTQAPGLKQTHYYRINNRCGRLQDDFRLMWCGYQRLILFLILFSVKINSYFIRRHMLCLMIKSHFREHLNYWEWLKALYQHKTLTRR